MANTPGKGRSKRPKEEPQAQSDMVVDGLLGDGFADPALPAVEEPKQVFWTAEQVKDRRPGAYQDCLDMLAGGMPVIRIARSLHLAPRTIAAIRSHGTTLAQHKQRVGSLQLLGSEMAAEAVIEDLSNPAIAAKIPTAAKAVISGILSQRGNENLSNGVSVNVTVSKVMDATEWDAWLRGMGSGGESPALKGATVTQGEAAVRAEDAVKGDAAPRVMEPRESHEGEAFDLPT